MTYVIVAYWRPREGQAEKIEAILRELAHAARQEPGNLEFVVNRSHDDPNEFLLYEQYKDEQAFIDHQQTPHFKKLVLEGALPLLERRERHAYSIIACDSSNEGSHTMSLAGKKVVVVGGSSGIGLATAELARQEGADVAVASRKSQCLQRGAE